MKWELVVFLVAVAGALGADFLTFPEVGREISRNSRIVSGWEAEEGQIPHQLSLRMVSPVGGVSGCGASLIHHEWALTAAHCTATRQTIIIRVGATNLTRPALIFEATEYYNHPLYNEAIANVVQPHDVGLVKFPFRVEYTNVIQPIRMQSYEDRSRNYGGERLIASGWGALWTQSASPEVLNWVYLVGVSNENCLAIYPGSTVIVDSTICAQHYNVTSQSTCQGDSGGPLTVVDRDEKLTVVGISSFVSSQGCHVGLPAGFCRPGFYHDWYTEVSGINFDWEWSDEPTTEAPSEEDSSEEDSSSEEEQVPEGSGWL